ncbi:CHAD domain-containing protein [Lysobacter korlensis]|uniref:CHAD domain-containing protein n=1 Tax=Lysobacter korlensis TaxID=553636 RepID=A0ABV6RLS5_9GAMM
MSFRLLESEGLEEGLRRIAAEQLAAAIQSGAGHDAATKTPHALRKRCKRMRGLLRLVRGSFGAYHEEQRALRDAARLVAPMRDADACIEALDRLVALDEARGSPTDIKEIRAWLDSSRAAAGGPAEQQRAVAQVVGALQQQLERVPDWTLQSDRFDAIAPGLLRTFRTGRDALKRARARPTPGRLHELRKHVKYHRFQLELLRGAWPGPLAAWAREARCLGDILGEHHDYAMLASALRDHAPGASITLASAQLMPIMEARSRELERDAIRLASRLYCEKPAAFERRMRNYWQTWRPSGIS